MDIDHPRVRKQWTCPICYGSKDLELVACWKCYRTSGLKDCEPDAEAKLDSFEWFLMHQETRR